MVMPTRYRAEITEICSGELIITADPDEQCLLVYPKPVYDRVEAAVAALPPHLPKAKRLKRALIAFASEVSMDGNGRLLIAEMLRQHAQIGKSAVLVGQGEKFELWDEESWNQLQASYRDEDEGELPDEILNLSY